MNNTSTIYALLYNRDWDLYAQRPIRQWFFATHPTVEEIVKFMKEHENLEREYVLQLISCGAIDVNALNIWPSRLIGIGCFVLSEENAGSNPV